MFYVDISSIPQMMELRTRLAQHWRHGFCMVDMNGTLLASRLVLCTCFLFYHYCIFFGGACIIRLRIAAVTRSPGWKSRCCGGGMFHLQIDEWQDDII